MSEAALSPEDRAFYQENGYLLVRGLFRDDELEPWKKRFLAVVNGEVEPAPGMLVMRDVMVAKGAVAAATREAAIAKIQDFEKDLVLYDGYVKNPGILAWVERFIGPDIKSIHTMLINKPPNVDGRHPLHQDLLYFPFRPADKIVASWTALEPCTRDNGCLGVVPGSHRGGLLPHANPDWEWLNYAYFGAEGVGADADRVHLEMDPGDTVFFHPLLLHGSGRNRSEGFRRAISAHYASCACHYVTRLRPVGTRHYSLVQGREHEGGI